MPSHADPEDLALRALGEEVPGLDAHLAECPQCRAELESLRSVVTTARSVEPGDAPVVPPPAVWEAVAAELRIGTATDLTARRARASRLRPVALAAALIIGVVAGIGATLLVTRDDPATTVLARAGLQTLDGGARGGDAEVLRTATGRELALVVRDLPPGDGFYEVWLLDREHKRLVPVGLLDGNRARFTLPADVDLADYPVVDVSLEPADGDPAHSGNSLVRGTLRG